MSEARNPLLFCLTSTRNYAWCTRAFLEVNTRWADYVVVVDQMSTDGTREMCAEYSNVVVLDNADLAYSETKRCEMALNWARSIRGDKILIYLAIDEVLPANIFKTGDWDKIVSSNPGDVFCLNWANILPNGTQYFDERGDMFRIFHDDGITPFNNQGKDMHTHCLPYPDNGTDYIVKDFPIIHFGHYNELWNYVKMRYYQMIDMDKTGHSAITLSRYYSDDIIVSIEGRPINQDWLYQDFDMIGSIDVLSTPILCVYMHDMFRKNGLSKYRKLDIWDSTMLDLLKMEDPRKWYHCLLHVYLHKTQRFRSSILVRGFDKILKKLC